MQQGTPVVGAPVPVSGEGKAYRFGRLAAHNTATMPITLRPRTAGQHVLSLNGYARLNGSGGPDSSQEIGEAIPTSWSITVKP
jgi:hypothetical protein